MVARVYVTRSLPGPALDELRRHAEVEVWPNRWPPASPDLRRQIRDAQGLLCLLTDRVDAELLAEAPNLLVMSNYAVGVDNIDLAAATARRIPVGNTPGVLTETTADLCMALLLSAARRIPEGVDYARSGKWLTWEPELLLGCDVHSACLGIVGMGRIGQAVCRRAKGFGMSLIYCDPHLLIPPADIDATRVSLDELLERADFVSLHAPLLPSTTGLLNAAALARLKPDAVLVNTARGGLVDTQALVTILEQRPRFRAALDVTDPEPLPAGHPLYSAPNCTIIPHLGSATTATRERMARMAVDNLVAGLEGRELPYCVNPQVYGGREP